MRICSSCGEAYPEAAQVCDLDGTALSSWQEATRIMLEPDDDDIVDVGVVVSAAPGADSAGFDGDDDRSTLPRIPDDLDDDDSDPGVEPTLLDDDWVARRATSPRTAPRAPALLVDDDDDDDDDDDNDGRDGRDDDEIADTAEHDPLAAAAAPLGVMAPRPGRLLGGRYLLRRQIAVGGFGAVFAAEDARLGKAVAVKVLSPHVAASPEHLARFRREALAASQIGDDGIVDVTDFDHDVDGTHFIVMELLDGCDLAQLIASTGPLPVPRALAIATQVASALDRAHRRGILHRDLKPANVFVTPRGPRGDRVKVIDFGISKVMRRRDPDATDLTQAGQVVGTPHYMAPEQTQGLDDIDGRVDVYGLGVILYEMVVGAPPFTGDNYLAIAFQHLSMAPVPPSQRRPGLPAALDDLILRAMEKHPGDRFPSMGHFADALTDTLAILDPIAAALVAPTDDAPVGHDGQGAATPRELPRRRRPMSTLRYSSGEVSALPPRRRAGPVNPPARSPARKLIAGAGLGVVAAFVITGASTFGGPGRPARRAAGPQPAPIPAATFTAPAPAPAPTPAPALIDAGVAPALGAVSAPPDPVP